MTREEWKIVFSDASANMTQEICDGIVHNVLPSQEKLIAQEIINQIFKAL